MKKTNDIETWDKVFKKPDQYLNYVIINAHEQQFPDHFIPTFILMSIGACLVSAKTKKARKFFEDTLRLVL